MNTPEGLNSKHVVVIGAGFGGIATVKRLLKKDDIRITVVERRNHHLFQPLLYQVATTTLTAPEIARSVRSIFADEERVTVIYDSVIDFNLPDKKVILDSGNELSYDYVVLATGARTSFFGNNHWREHTHQLKSLSGAFNIRRDVLRNIELAERCDKVCQNETGTVVIVGGGPTGVELAGAFADLIRRSMGRNRNFKNFKPDQQRIILVEGMKNVLGVFDEDQSIYAKKKLESLGVEVRTEAMVENIEPNLVTLKGGEQIKAGTIIWTAGVEATPLTQKLGVELTRGGLVITTDKLNIKDHPEFFVIGDTAAVAKPEGGFVPGVAPAATQGGEYAANCILGEIQGPPVDKPFSYHDKGKMAIIGKGSAIVDINGIKAHGFIGWLLWLFVHVILLIDFRSKLSVLASWVWSYCSDSPGSRVFTTSSEEKE